MATHLNPSRQYPLVAIQPLTFEDIKSADAFEIMSLPRDAIITDAQFNVSDVFDITLKLGDDTTEALYGTADLTGAGVKAYTPTGVPSGKTRLYAKPSAAATKGVGWLIVTYVLPLRGNEAQP